MFAEGTREGITHPLQQEERVECMFAEFAGERGHIIELDEGSAMVRFDHVFMPRRVPVDYLQRVHNA
jgi:hypothetical protein